MMASNVDQDHLKKESDIQFLLEAFETYIIGCLKGDCVKVILSYRELSHGKSFVVSDIIVVSLLQPRKVIAFDHF